MAAPVVTVARLWIVGPFSHYHFIMSDSIEFTPKEKYQISLYKDPDGLFRRSAIRQLWYLIPSIGLVAYSLFCGDIAYGIMGYALLLFRSIYRLTIVKRGLLTMASIIQKYEAQLQAKQGPSQGHE